MRPFVGQMKPNMSTHDTTMQGLGTLLGNGTIVTTSMGDFNTQLLPNHIATSNSLCIDKSYPNNQTVSKKKKARKKSNIYPNAPDAPACAHAPSTSLNFPLLVSPHVASFSPNHGSNFSDQISIDDKSKNYFFREVHYHVNCFGSCTACIAQLT
jgi:hypothetical protein